MRYLKQSHGERPDLQCIFSQNLSILTRRRLISTFRYHLDFTSYVLLGSMSTSPPASDVWRGGPLTPTGMWERATSRVGRPDRTAIHCCQTPSGLLGQFSQKNSAAGEKIRPQAGHPPNHQKKCSKKFFATNFWVNFCKLLLKLGRN